MRSTPPKGVELCLQPSTMDMMAMEENSTFQFTPGQRFEVTSQIQKSFDRDGYIVIRSLIPKEELSKLKEELERDDGIMKYSYIVSDGHGRNCKQCQWNHPGNDITGMVGRCEKVAGTMEQLLGGEVYHYHTKLMMKEAHTGGSFVWHQDYGYWYNYGILYSDMGTVFIAIDKTDQENGCLKVLKGSHRCGRIEHKQVGGQMGADTERVEQIRKVLPLVEVEMEAGDALFFHCNLLHCSDKNDSDRRRWAFLIAYNRASNNPTIRHHHPQYTRLEKVPDMAILECQSTNDFAGKDFMNYKTDYHLSYSKTEES